MRNGLSYSEAGKLGYINSIEKNKARFRDIREKYDRNPKKCKYCGSSIEYKKRSSSFCNHACSASFNNKGIRRHGSEPSKCKYCDKRLSKSNSVYCSSNCQHKFHWEKIKDRIRNGTYKVTFFTGNQTLKKFLVEERGAKCSNCGLSEWMDKDMPLVCDHINGDSSDNRIENLRLVCNNCDAISLTYKGKNRGKGRAARRRYRKEYKEKNGFYY